MLAEDTIWYRISLSGVDSSARQLPPSHMSGLCNASLQPAYVGRPQVYLTVPGHLFAGSHILGHIKRISGGSLRPAFFTMKIAAHRVTHRLTHRCSGVVLVPVSTVIPVCGRRLDTKRSIRAAAAEGVSAEAQHPTDGIMDLDAPSGRDRTSEASTSSQPPSSGQAPSKKKVRPPPVPVKPPRLDPVILQNGVLLIDKPLEWTSFDVCAKVRNSISKSIGVRKVGHAGTLDPMASGLLIVCTGTGTKSIGGWLPCPYRGNHVGTQHAPRPQLGCTPCMPAPAQDPPTHGEAVCLPYGCVARKHA